MGRVQGTQKIHGWTQIGSRDAILGTGLLNPRRGDAQVPVVFQGRCNQQPKLWIGKEIMPVCLGNDGTTETIPRSNTRPNFGHRCGWP